MPSLDCIVVTTFPGYFFTTLLCVRSINKYFPSTPIHILIDDINLERWPTYVQDVKTYLTTEFTDSQITFEVYSTLKNNLLANTGCMAGWIRQQLIKLHIDILVPGDNWLVVDADVIFEEFPVLDNIPAHKKILPDPIDIGNREYVNYMLNIDKPYIGPEDEYWCVSWLPYRVLSKELLVSLRSHVENTHKTNFLDLHLILLKENKILTNGGGMTMSEFQLIDTYRYQNNLNLFGKYKLNSYKHTNVKDWDHSKEWFTNQNIKIYDQYWNNIRAIRCKYL